MVQGHTEAAAVVVRNMIRSTSAVPHRLDIADRTDTVIGMDCQLPGPKQHLPADTGTWVDTDTGQDTGTDILDLRGRQWTRSPANLNNFPVFPFACPSTSLSYKVLLK